METENQNVEVNATPVVEPVKEQGQDTTNDFKAPQSQSELDSLTNKAVQKALANYKKGEEQRIAEAIQKQQDYAKLSDAERAKKEFEDQKADFEKQVAEFNHNKLLVDIEKDLVSKGLPSDLAGTFALAGNADEALKAVSVFEKVFNDAVAEKVKASLRQSTPSASSGISGATNYGQQLAQKFN